MIAQLATTTMTHKKNPPKDETKMVYNMISPFRNIF